ncbi:hypothetical protein [Acinetobacter pittii]|uniref:hypothetical protein n=1 Tax=Acinetobacter pittii TaxID=48296 RepID=UPI0019803319|nr:hypothetical protein [Acinetobacter pittii]MBN6492929.1 hypothetical protein [Acinetobacter pittii]MDO7427525.1 hypothetical protein [Acinetobacter baumannii]
MSTQYLFVLSNTSEVYLFLTFRTKDLTHSERIDIILEVERTIESDIKKRTHLIWDNGFGSGDLTIWSEFHAEESLELSSFGNFFKNFKVAKYPLPTYLEYLISKSTNFQVFPSEGYIQRFLKTISMKI